ncbi:hypothetical protein [Nocardia sp. NPDC002869]|uniref:hypothetical protein n=1 Tax=Nocardia sp. NPDC002869 TaxID=3161032 RepID=UPI00398CEA46
MSESKPTDYSKLPKPRTDEQARERFEQWHNDYRHQAYVSAIHERGGTPWSISLGEQLDLYKRRYKRPEPPAGMKAKNLSEINRHEFDPSADRVPAFNY